MTIPLSTTRYKAIDKKNSTPKYFRPTLRFLLNTGYTFFRRAQFPFGVAVQPFADVQDDVIPLYKEVERCNSCKAYANPWFVFNEMTSEFKCNMCETTGFSTKQFTDKKTKFNVGTYDITSKEVFSEQYILFVIEATTNSINNGNCINKYRINTASSRIIKSNIRLCTICRKD
jgi:hypothetical protein